MQPERMGVLTENHTGRMVFFNKEENFICTVQIFTDWAHVLMVISSAYFEQEKKKQNKLSFKSNAVMRFSSDMDSAWDFRVNLSTALHLAYGFYQFLLSFISHQSQPIQRQMKELKGTRGKKITPSVIYVQKRSGISKALGTKTHYWWERENIKHRYYH